MGSIAKLFGFNAVGQADSGTSQNGELFQLGGDFQPASEDRTEFHFLGESQKLIKGTIYMLDPIQAVCYRIGIARMYLCQPNSRACLIF
jgi:hypothetical protein